MSSSYYQAQRKRSFEQVKKFIDKADVKELALIVEEIRFNHGNLYIYNKRTKQMEPVTSLEYHGNCVQLNICE